MPKRDKGGSGTTKVPIRGIITCALTNGSFVDQVNPTLFGAPLVTIAGNFMFYRFKRLKFRIVDVIYDTTVAEAGRRFAFGFIQASNSITAPLFATSENNPANVQYGCVFRLLPSGGEGLPYTVKYEWMEPFQALGPYGGWFRTEEGADDEDGDSSGILTISMEITTNNSTQFLVEYEVDCEFKEVVENTVTPLILTKDSLLRRYPNCRSDPGCSKPKVLSVHPALLRFRPVMIRHVSLGAAVSPFGDPVLVDYETAAGSSSKSNSGYNKNLKENNKNQLEKVKSTTPAPGVNSRKGV